MKTVLVDINAMQKTNDLFHVTENKRLSKSMANSMINSGNFHNSHFVNPSTGKLDIEPKRFYSVTTNSTKPLNSFNTLPYTVVNSVRYNGFNSCMKKRYLSEREVRAIYTNIRNYEKWVGVL
ncbi:MAG: hypothetical protein EOP34_03930 [Rickettsiales bacterium]|nr:MAG: hypothetical protein EOP34_03930 [Rickettsiales bacterium]